MDTEDTEYSNVATTLREIAANSDKTTGKILKRIKKAANKGEYYIIADVPYNIYKYIESEKNEKISLILPPMIEKLRSLGFTLKLYASKQSWLKIHYYIYIVW